MILEFLREQFLYFYNFIKNTVLFEPTIWCFDFPITMLDCLLGLSVASVITMFFGFIADDNSFGDYGFDFDFSDYDD